MFGTNEIAKQRLPKDYSVKEIFYTLQGEGPYVGQPALFVRFAGCNLRCFWCDTDFTGGTLYDLEGLTLAITAELMKYPKCKLIVFTGGEPMLQDVPSLVQNLRATPSKYEGLFQIETAGTLLYPHTHAITHVAHIVCSPKTPLIDHQIVTLVKSWKYIIRLGEVSPVDGLPMMSTQFKGKYVPIFRPPAWHPAPIYVQPCTEDTHPKTIDNTLLARDIALQFGYRLSLQIHKMVDLP